MRKQKTVNIDDKRIEVYELRVKDVRMILNAADDMGDMSVALGKILPRATNIPVDEFEDLAPSEIKQLWAAFREVNEDFLSPLDRAGVGQMILTSIQETLTEAFADSSSAAMSALGNTACLSSKTPVH